jgi:signal transduction histidine kinase
VGPLQERIRRWGSQDLARSADVVAIVASVFLTVVASDGPGAWSPFPRPVAVAAGLAGAAALWWRRSHPTTVAAVNVVAVAFSANLLPTAVALYTAATLAPAAPLAALVVTGSVAVAVPEWVDDGHVRLRVLVGSTATVVAIVCVGLYSRTRRDLTRSLRARAEGAEAERELRAEQARAGERARIAREMHDVLAHKVSLIALHAGALEVNPGVGPERVEEAAGLIRLTAAQAMEELRSVLGVLREGAGPEDALVPPPQAVDIARLVESSRRAGVDAALREDVPDLPDGLGRVAYRVVQEALTNVHKHAPGAAAVVDVAGGEVDGLTITVENDPPLRLPRVALPGSGAGLVGLRERVRLAGGRLSSGPTAGGGWRVTAWVPWTGDSVGAEGTGGTDVVAGVGEGSPAP